MKKQRYISIHQAWPFSPSLLCHSIAHTHSFSPHLCFKFQLEHGVTQSGSYNNVIYHISSSPSTELLKYVIDSVIKGSVCGCQCAPSSVVANFKLEAFLPRAGDLAQQNNWPHHMRNTPVYVQSRTHTHPRYIHRLRVAFVGWMMDHPGE